MVVTGGQLCRLEIARERGTRQTDPARVIPIHPCCAPEAEAENLVPDLAGCVEGNGLAGPSSSHKITKGLIVHATR